MHNKLLHISKAVGSLLGFQDREILKSCTNCATAMFPDQQLQEAEFSIMSKYMTHANS